MNTVHRLRTLAGALTMAVLLGTFYSTAAPACTVTSDGKGTVNRVTSSLHRAASRIRQLLSPAAKSVLESPAPQPPLM
jgi:hypothetical protein